MTLLRWLDTWLWHTILLFFIYLFFLMVVLFSAMAFDPLGNSDHFVSIFLSISKQDAPFPGIAYDNSCGNRDGLHDHLRDVPWEDIFKFSASAPAREFYEWLQVVIVVCIPQCIYQFKPHLSPWFSGTCAAAAIAHRKHFFCLYQQNKSS